MFRWKPADPEGDGSNEINMTPLIDVSLVLVVMLLLAAPLAFESSIAVRESKAAARTGETKRDIERVEISVVSEDHVRVNGVLIPRAELMKELHAVFEDSGQRFVVVDCRDNVSHSAFVDVLDQAALVGAANIAVVGE